MKPNCSDAAAVRFPKTKGTWSMNREELARVVANEIGVHAHRHGGGWLYDLDERPVVQGWSAYADRLERGGAIVVGRGIVWTRVPLPRSFRRAISRATS